MMSFLNWLLGSLPGLTLIGLVIVGGLAWLSQVGWIRRVLFFAIALIPALLLVLVGAFSILVWWLVGPVTDILLRFIPLDRGAAWLLALPARFSRMPLVRGDRAAVARRMWPPGPYPDLYEHPPEDLVRPPYEDGRLLGGLEITWLADRYLHETAYRSALRGGFKGAVVVLILLLTLILTTMVMQVFDFVPALFEGARPVIEQWPGAEPVKVSTWSLIGANLGPAVSNLVGQLGALIVYLPATALLAAGVGVIIFLILLNTWLRAKSEPYRLATKDADVRWPFRIESRNLIRETYRKQLRHAVGYLNGASTYLVGAATGTLRARGDLAAPTPNQPLKLDRESLFQHLLVLGGTGEGKTTAVIKPLLRQVLADPDFGAFISDAKGVLWRDAVEVAEALGRSGDVVVLGTGDGQRGLDPIASLQPTQVASVLRSVLRQMGGGESQDSFWPDMAATVLRHALTIGKAYAATPAGQAESGRTGVNPYSLWWAYQAVVSKDGLTPVLAALEQEREAWRAKVVAAEKKGDSQGAAGLVEQFTATFSADLAASIRYMSGAWPDMAEETRTGIIANTTQLLDGFSGARTLRERFASGPRPDSVDLRKALDGGIILNALSTIEDGLPARLTAILIKTALYREARQRETDWKATDGAGSPQDRPCLVLMDEVQELATVDPASGLSDASFWNVARSTGLAGVFASQSLAALNQAMGHDAADNFVQQARSKIFMRVEEQATVDYACWCAGEFERNRVYEDQHRESLEYRWLIDGFDPLAPIDEREEIIAGPGAFFSAALGLLFPSRMSLAAARRKATYEVDDRFATTDGASHFWGLDRTDAPLINAAERAVWRSEDLTRQYRTQGNERQPALSPADIIHMGRWHAFAHIQRAGAVRQDIVRLTHDFDREA